MRAGGGNELKAIQPLIGHGGNRHVHRRVGGEEAERHQRKAHVVGGHDRPFFRAYDVGDAGDVPDDDIVVGNRPVAGGPLGQAVIDFVAGGIETGWIFFALIVLGYPKLVVEEAGFLTHDGAGRHKGLCLAAGHEHISDVLAKGIVDLVVLDVPAAAAFIVDGSLRFQFFHEVSMFDDKRIAVGIVLAGCNEPGIHLHHAIILCAVNVHVQAEYKEVLVVHGFDIGMDECPKGHSIVREIVFVGCVHLIFSIDTLYLYNTGELDVHIDGTVLFESPGKPIVIVLDGSIVFNRQVGCPARDGAMTPQGAAIFFIDGHCIIQNIRVSVVTVQDGGFVKGVFGGIGAGSHRARDVLTKPVFTGIEEVVRGLQQAGGAIRDDHLRHRTPVHHSAFDSLVNKPDIV